MNFTDEEWSVVSDVMRQTARSLSLIVSLMEAITDELITIRTCNGLDVDQHVISLEALVTLTTLTSEAMGHGHKAQELLETTFDLSGE